jgi:aspartyl-tRNA synthetase
LSYRTHTCGELRTADAGKNVVLLGWVHRVRDLGGVIFFDIRDRYGITQVVVRERNNPSSAWPRVRPEFVVAVEGHVEKRATDSVNPKIDTGEIEVMSRKTRACAIATSIFDGRSSRRTSYCGTVSRWRRVSTSTGRTSSRSRRRS